MTGVVLKRADDRMATHWGWLDSKHSFSFADHYDAANTHFGLLLVSNDDVVLPGFGFETHPHRDMEIVTWVLDGGLVHQDSQGNNGVIYPGLAQRMSAGAGILHSEKNDAAGFLRSDKRDAASGLTVPGRDGLSEPVHFIQMWVVPDERGTAPGYQQLDIGAELARGGLVPVASGRGHDAAISIGQSDAALFAARLAPGESVALPDAPYVHLFVARGSVELEGAGVLAEGDAARLAGTDGPKVTAVKASADGRPAEILVWEMHSTLA